MLNELAATPDSNKTSVWQHIMRSLELLDRDVPLAILYSALEDPNSKRCSLSLQGSLGILTGHEGVPLEAELYESNDALIPHFREAKVKGGPIALENLPLLLNENKEWRGFGEPSKTFVIIPFAFSEETLGFLVVGLNPRRSYDKDLQQFVQDIGQQCSIAVKSGNDFNKLRAREFQLSKQLSHSQQLSRRMAEIAPVGMFNANAEGVIKWANAKCVTL